jgi:hypothetical protein
MEAKDLRVSNVVSVDGFTVVVDSITNVGINIFVADNELIEYADFGNEAYHVKPIELTPEWHAKFGIKFDGHLQFEYMIDEKIECYYKKVVFSDDYVYLRQSTDKYAHNDQLVTLWNNDTKKRPMWVHEWQNMYSLLTGNELQLIK